MAWTFPYGAEELQVFLQETEEQLQALEAGLLALEGAGPNGELVAGLFRAAHTLKGAAGTVGHQPLATLTHALEGVLDGFRSGRLAYSPALGDALLATLDRLRALQAAIAAGGGGEEDVTGDVARLQAAAGGETPGPAAAPARASEPPAAGPAGTVQLRVRLAAGCAMPAVRAYQVLQAAEACGEVRAAEPSREDIARERVGDRLVLAVAGADPERLVAAVRAVPEVADVAVAAAPAPAAAPAAGGVQQSVRVDVTLLDRLMNLVGELVIDRTRLARLAALLAHRNDDGHRELSEIASHLGRVTADLQDEVMRARLLPVETLFRKFPRLVRDAARQTGKEVRFVVEGQDTELDRSVLEQIGDPLMHLLRNAVDHGIEAPAERQRAGKDPTGTVRLRAEHRENHVVICVEDDGAGMDAERLRAAAVAKGLLGEEAARRLGDAEALQLIFAPGFTTREQVTALSGRGVGMDVVKRNIERLNGSVHVETAAGRGSRFVIRLPLTLAIVRALLVRVAGTVLALPLSAIVEVARADPDQLGHVRGAEVVRLRGRVLPLIRGARVLAEADDAAPASRPLVHLQAGDQPVALLVDELLGEQEVVIKGLDRRAGPARGFTGAAVLADGRVALVVDPSSLLRAVHAVA